MLQFSSGFGQGSKSLNLAEPGSNQLFLMFISYIYQSGGQKFALFAMAMCTIVWMTNHQIAIKLSTLDPSELSEAWLTCLMVGARLCIAATTAVFNSVVGSQHY